VPAKEREGIEKRSDEYQGDWLVRQTAVGAFPKKRVHAEQSSLGALCQRTVHDSKRVIALDVVNFSDS